MKEINLNGKTIKRTIWCVIIVMVIVPWQVVFACSLPDPLVLVNCQISPKFLQNEAVCLDDECNYKIEFKPYWRYSHVVMFNEKALAYFNDNQLMSYELSDFQIANQVCSENFDAYIPTFEKFHEDWLQIHRGNIIGSKLIIEPYSEVREAEFVKIQYDLLSCNTVIFEHVGGWLVSVETIKEYCYQSLSVEIFSFISICGKDPYISPFSFITYLFRHPGLKTIPYYSMMIITTALVLEGLISLYRRNEMKMFFKPSKITSLGFLLSLPGFCILLGILDIYSLLIIIFGLYFVLSIINYIIRRKRKMKPA